jgi:PTS system ascorbate-specific IIB component
MKILAICGNGMGTSLVIKMKVKKFLEANNISAQVESCALSEAAGYLAQGIDIALCSQQLTSGITPPKRTHLVGLKNLMDENEFGPAIMKIISENSLT